MKPFIFIVIIFCVLSSSATDLFACNLDIPGLRQRYRNADAVFIGEVINKNEGIFSVPASLKEYSVTGEITVNILKSWKGAKQSEMKFFSSSIWGCPDDAFGGSKINVGEKYLIFADKINGKNLFFLDGSPYSAALSTEETKSSVKRLNNFGFRLWANLYPF